MKAPRVLFHLTVPPGAPPGTDAVVQEVEALRNRLGGGQVLHLYPGRRPGSRIPRRWWGLQHLPRLSRLERQVDLHHVFNPDPFPFALLSRLRRPVVYSAVAGAGIDKPAGARVDPVWRRRIALLGRRVACLTVPTESDRRLLGGLGATTVAVIPPGIDRRRFPPMPAPPPEPFVLFAGSAPWTLEQFDSKGVSALLEATRREPALRVTFLWRGLLADEMRRRVAAAGLAGRVELLDRKVDVAAELASAHAAVVLAARPLVVRDFPHSLLEALSAGRPVLVSPTLAISELVAERGCGEIVDRVSPEAVLEALGRLRCDYDRRRRAALAIPAESFSLDGVVAAHERVYREVLARGKGAS